MSTTITHNQDIGLYSFKEFQAGRRKLEECIPEHLETGAPYPFRKPGHRNYKVGSIITLLEMTPDDVLFELRAQICIEESGFVAEDGTTYTKGTYSVEEILTS